MRYGLHVQMSDPKTSEPLPGSDVSTRRNSFRDAYIHRGRAASVPSSRQTDMQGFRLGPSQRNDKIARRDMRTDVCGEVADRREEDLDIRAGDEFGVHPSRILEERTAEQALRAVSQ